MINVAVCDDNKAFLELMCRAVNEMMTEFGVAFQVTDYLSGTVFLEHHKQEPFDVVFLDIVMPKQNGFEIAKEIRKISEKTYIIFVTTEDGLVYDSFDFRPFYFVPKSSSELFKARLYHVIEKLAAHLFAKRPIYLEMAFGEKRYVEPSEIISVTSKANYIDYCLSSGEILHVRGRMEDAENILSPRLFARIHNRNIINMAHVKRPDYPNNQIIMNGDRTINISRKYKKEFDEAYTKYLRDFS